VIDWPTGSTEEQERERRIKTATARLREAEELDPEDQELELHMDDREDRLCYGVMKHVHGLDFEDEDGEPVDTYAQPDEIPEAA
jgi:hypothetical protein